MRACIAAEIQYIIAAMNLQKKRGTDMKPSITREAALALLREGGEPGAYILGEIVPGEGGVELW